MKNLHRTIRQTQQSGAHSYAKVESVNLGYATVRLATNGARLTNLPVTGGELQANDTCIVDYSSGVPPTVRPIAITQVDEETELEKAKLVAAPEPPAAEEPPESVYWTGGDHGVKAYQWGGTYTTVFESQWTTVRLSGVDWDTEANTDFPFFSTNEPYQLYIPAPGFYYCIADICWGPGGTPAGIFYHHPPGIFQIYNYVHDLPANLNIAIDGSISGRQVFNTDYPIARDHSTNKAMQAIGMAKFEAGETVSLKVQQDMKDSVNLIQEYNVFPKIVLQWVGNYES